MSFILFLISRKMQKKNVKYSIVNEILYAVIMQLCVVSFLLIVEHVTWQCKDSAVFWSLFSEFTYVLDQTSLVVVLTWSCQVYNLVPFKISINQMWNVVSVSTIVSISFLDVKWPRIKD